MQSDKDFLNEVNRHKRHQKKKRFSFTNDYIIGDVCRLIEYFKGDNE